MNDLDINPRIIDVAERGGFSTPWKVVGCSVADIMSRTSLNPKDVENLTVASAKYCSPKYETVDGFCNNPSRYIPSGCSIIDSSLSGGIPLIGVTEISGESGVGKTQFALQLALQAQLNPHAGGLGKGVVYICTESQFPSNRLKQMVECKSNIRTFNGKDFLDNIFVHYISDMQNLSDCIRYQLPYFTKNQSIGLIIIDSIASVFRAAENCTQTEKTKHLQKIGYNLHNMSQKMRFGIIAINQVTCSISGNDFGISSNIVPALGLSWATYVTTRIILWKTSYYININDPSGCLNEGSCSNPSKSDKTQKDYKIRTLEVSFCPFLPKKHLPYIVTHRGIEDVTVEQSHWFLIDDC